MTAPADGLTAAVALARALRAEGVAASGDRVAAFVAALGVLDPHARDDVRWAGRAALCAGPDDLEVFEHVFRAWADGTAPTPAVPAAAPAVAVVVEGLDRAAGDGEEADAAAAVVSASAREVLRHRDVAALDDAERAEVARLLAAFRLPGEARRTRRLVPARRGAVDPRRTLRDVLERGGEPADLRRRARRSRPRRVVLLVDVSGSMRPYADALLRFAHAAARRAGRGEGGGAPRAPRTEVFTLGTRLTHVTEPLSARDPDDALAAVAAAVPDWAGGTRLGPLLEEVLDAHGHLLRGAVAVVLSDGWERGDAALLGAQTARLSRLAHRVVWANPLKARPGYAPLAAGMAAALPHVDAFVEGHSVAALEALARVVAGAAVPRNPGVPAARAA